VDKGRDSGQFLFDEDSFPHNEAIHYQRIIILDDKNPSFIELMTISFPVSFVIQKLSVQKLSV
jgi:hypothetical protein